MDEATFLHLQKNKKIEIIQAEREISFKDERADDFEIDVLRGAKISSSKIDYLIRSITNEKINDLSLRQFSFNFESLNGWSVIGTNVNVLGGVLVVSRIVSDPTWVEAAAYSGLPLTWNKLFIGQFGLQLTNIIHNDHYLVIGKRNMDLIESQGVGFKISEGVLYAYHCAMVASIQKEVATIIGNINLSAFHVYRVEFNPGVNIKYYIDDILVAIHSTDLPSGIFYTSPLFSFAMKNTQTPDYNSQQRIIHPYLVINL